MAQWILFKITRILTVLVGVALLTFLLMHAVPGTPWNNYSADARAMYTVSIDTSTLNQLNRHFGLDQPLWRQFTRYLLGDFNPDAQFFCGAICGNLGPSIRQRGRTVQEILFEPPEEQPFWQSRFGYSIRMVVFSALLAAGLGIPLGIWSAYQPRSTRSRVVSVALAALLSIPNFVLGLVAIIVLASWLKIIKVLPDWDNPMHWITPAVVLAVMPMAGIARVTQTALMNILGEDFIRTARAKGLSNRRVMLVHVLRNALAPILTFLGPTLIELFAGLLIIENLYAFPGFGREYWEAVLNLDYPMILGLTLLYAVGISVVNMIIEILNGLLDPRIRAPQERSAS